MLSVRFHHVSLSVRNLEKSTEFYEALGFETALVWRSTDKDLRIAHLRLDGFVLELFAYSANENGKRLSMDAGNNLAQHGVKHFALQTESLAATRATLVASGYTTMTDDSHGRTGIDYFFVQDPDGMWVEIAEDHRDLRPGSVIELEG